MSVMLAYISYMCGATDSSTSVQSWTDKLKISHLMFDPNLQN